MDKPNFPLISIYNKALEIIASENVLTNTSALEIILRKNSDKESFVFDNNGSKWTYKLKTQNFKINFVSELLAFTFYNPAVKADISWIKLDDYNLSELKNVIFNCIEEDDDILTQFVNSKTLGEAINNSDSFEDVYESLRKYCFEFNEDELRKDFEK